MINKEKQQDLFFKNIEGASEFFYIDSKGNLHTHVNTDYMFSKYNLQVIFNTSNIQIITQIEDIELNSLNNWTRQAIEDLFESLNSINKNGHFYIDCKTDKLSFISLCLFEDLINADNPWLVLFSGIETTAFFADSIQDVINGSKIFYIKQNIK